MNLNQKTNMARTKRVLATLVLGAMIGSLGGAAAMADEHDRGRGNNRGYYDRGWERPRYYTPPTRGYYQAPPHYVYAPPPVMYAPPPPPPGISLFFPLHIY